MTRRSAMYGAFTLVELLIVLAIISILSVLLIPNASSLIAKAQGVVCTGKLRNLWTVFSGTLSDGTGWPQLPSTIPVDSMQEQQWWLDTTASLGLKPSDWQCPTISSRMSGITNPQARRLISYVPTLFDANPMTPRTWPRMPWFTEAAAVHGNGMLSVRADGSVCPVMDP